MGQASVNPATLPSVLIDTTYQTPTGRSIPLGPSDDLQAALNAALPGDELVLQAGASWVGNFILPAKACGMVTIRTSALTAFPEGVRATPSQVASMASIISPNSAPAINAAPGACGYQLVGIEATVQSGTINYSVVALGVGSESAAQLPSTIFIERSWIHGTPACSCKRGVQMNGKNQAVVDSTITDIHYQGIDSQAVEGWAGPGPFKVVNNELQAGSEVVCFGGAPPSVVGTIPSDIEIRRNHITRPLSWMGGGWLVKNLFELKNAQRVLFDSNIAENNWVEGQAGFAVLFQGITVDSGDWAIVSDVTVTNNIIRHSANGINYCGGCYLTPNAPLGSKATRIFVANNLFDDIGNTLYSAGNQVGIQVQILTNTANVTMDHNTFVSAASAQETAILDGPPSPGITLTSNIFGHGGYGILGNSFGEGTPAINHYLPGSVVTGNLLAAPPAGGVPPYPSGNAFPPSWDAIQFANFNNGSGGDYHLAAGSPYITAGVGGSVPGADITMLNANTANVISGSTSGIAIAITSPSFNSTFTTSRSTINLSGTAFDSAGVTQVTWATDHGASGFATGTSNWAINGLALPTGVTKVTVTARNTMASQGSAMISLTYTPDSTPPVIAVTSPTSTGTYSASSSTINLAGTASDDVGVAQVTWATDKGATGTATGTSNWTISGVPVSSGSTQITVTARDAAGNASSALLAVTSSFSGLSDTTPPTIVITSPTSGSSFTASSSTISIAGTASDNAAVTQVTWSTDKGASGIATGTTNWTINGLTLASGTTQITVTASDASGNVASRSLTVAYTAPDTTSPTIAITSPTTGTTFSTTGTSITLNGIAADNIGVTQIAWVTDRGGSGVASGTTSWSTGGIPLQSGSTQITVTAYDRAGNQAQRTLAVTTPPQPDTTAPTINITSPTSAATFSTAGTTISLSGTATDNVGVTQVTWVSSAGGSGLAAGTSSWNASGIALQSGSNQLTVTARDAAGNQKSAIITVTSTASNPVKASSVVITSPTSSPVYTTSVDTVSLAGTASASAGVIQVTWSADRGDGSGIATGTTSWVVNQVNLKNGTNTITITARDSANDLSSQVIQVVYSPPSVKTKNLPKAQAGQQYTYSLAVDGGVPPYSWSASALPAGLSLSPDGLISGKPLTTGTYDVNVVVHDSAVSDSATLTLSVDPWVDFVSTATFSPAWAAPQSMLTAVGWQLSAGTATADPGSLPTILADTTVTVRDAEGKDHLSPLYYVSPDQINFVVPAETALGNATITIASAGRSVISDTIYVASVAPSIFEANAEGLAAANLLRIRGDVSEYDPISQRDPTTSQVVAVPIDLSPETDSFFLIMYGTGVRFRSSVDSVKATVGGIDAPVVYAGSAGSSDGLDVLSIKLPTEVHGWADVVTTVDGVAANTVRILIK